MDHRADYVLALDNGHGRRGGHLLVATGRRPRVDGLGLETVGGTTQPCQQLRMMRLYIDDRYGSTKSAKKFWKRNHLY